MPDSAHTIDPKLLQKMRSKKPAEREQAEAEINRLGPEAVDALMRVMESEAGSRKKRRTIGVVVLSAWVVLMLTAAITRHAENIGTFSGMFTMITVLFAATQLQKNAVSVLAQYDDKRAAGYMAEALEYNDSDVAKGAEGALIRLLPRLQATDHGVLTPEQRRCLDRALVKKGKSDLALAILGAYEQVGDPLSVPVVEKLASGQVRSVKDARVVARAAEALPAIRERAEQVRDAQTLLRPAAPADGADTLLRPAVGAPEGSAELLVRPIEAPDDAAPAHGSDAAEDVAELTAGPRAG